MFKPFAHDPSGQVYQDGAIYYNCPVELAMQEQRLIWPDRAKSYPDVILSIGTGINEVRRKVTPPGKALRRGVFSQLKNLTKIAIDRIQSSMNSEQTWRNYVQQTNPPLHLKDCYVRLNLRMKTDPPKMDDVSQLANLKNATLLQFAPNEAKIKSVADRLLATSFYFSLDREPFAAGVDGDVTIVSGTIHCRFAAHSSEIRSLGEALRRRSRNAYNQNLSQHNPYFVIQERGQELKAKQIVLSADVVDRMTSDGVFSMDKIQIPQIDVRAETDILFCFGDQPEHVIMYPISGFPRNFKEELGKGWCASLMLNEYSLTLEVVPRPKLGNPSQTKTPQVLNLSWAAFEAKKSSWKFDAATFLRSKDPFKYYSSPDYVNPGNATDVLVEELSSRFSGNTRTTANMPMERSQSIAPRETVFGETPSELFTERELHKDQEGSESSQPTSEAEIIRMQFLRLLLSRGSLVTGPPRLPVSGNPILLHPDFAIPAAKPATKLVDQVAKLDGESNCLRELSVPPTRPVELWVEPCFAEITSHNHIPDYAYSSIGDGSSTSHRQAYERPVRPSHKRSMRSKIESLPTPSDPS